MSLAPTLVWIRRDLRLTDHAALTAAVDRGGPVIPVFIRDAQVDALPTAPKWRLGLGVDRFGATLRDEGSGLVLRSGDPLAVLRALIAETGATAVFWQRAYDPDGVARDTDVKAGLTGDGVTARSFAGHLLFEPWTTQTGQGGFYKVYSPFWRAVNQRDVPAPLSRPTVLTPPDHWPQSDDLADWQLGAGMRRGADVVRAHLQLGEAAAQARLADFVGDRIAGYKEDRNRPDLDATSNMSENLSLGEISPGQCWHAGRRALEEGKPGAEHWLKELVWREFAYHLMWHTPHILTDSWRDGWGGFPWNTNPDRPDVLAWKQGRTGVRFVDAAMREMYVTGRMHNRARMIVASYLTKHLMAHWKIGRDWFADCLVDWDPAANAMGWQWTAGSGPDAAPYFRVFNPDTQAEKFDADGRYRNRWLAEGQRSPPASALSYFDAIPRSWNLSPDLAYPTPVVDLKEGRNRALAAYQAHKGD